MHIHGKMLFMHVRLSAPQRCVSVTIVCIPTTRAFNCLIDMLMPNTCFMIHFPIAEISSLIICYWVWMAT